MIIIRVLHVRKKKPCCCYSSDGQLFATELREEKNKSNNNNNNNNNNNLSLGSSDHQKVIVYKFRNFIFIVLPDKIKRLNDELNTELQCET